MMWINQLRLVHAMPRPAQRGSHGATPVVAFMSIVFCLWASLATALEISVRQLDDNSFEFTLTNSAALGEREAQAYISSAAASVCKGSTPMLGKYQFESKQAVGSDPPAKDPGSFRFTQQVTCSVSAQLSADVRHPILGSPDEAKAIQEDIFKRSESHFRLLAAKRFDEAYAEVSGTVLGVGATQWKAESQAFQAIAGELIAISIVKVTVYDNPAEAPEPGLYVAADFSNTYANVPINCGYLVWYRPVDGGEFKITRQETGYVTNEQLKSIPSTQLPAIKQGLRCVAP